jgi:hypothetical protein
MKDSYKVILVMLFVPVMVSFGFSEVCANEFASFATTALTAVGLGLWKWTKKD